MEDSSEFTSRLDRDSVYRIHALNNAVNRAELHRSMKNDNSEVLAYATVYYNWLKGDGHSVDEPKAEELNKG